MANKKLSPAELLALRKFNPKKQIEPERVVYKIRGEVIGCLQSLVVFTGIPKSGKSTFLAATVASGLIPGEVFSMDLITPTERKRICYIDTESSDFDFYKQIERIKNFAGLKGYSTLLDAFCCREDEPPAMIEAITHYLQCKPDCSVLILDGLLDMLFDYNDIKESKRLINWIKQITKNFNILVIGVLHTGKKGENTLGHLGAMADRLVQSSVKIERNKEAGTFDLSPAFLRSAYDFEPVRLQNINGTWYQIDAPEPEPTKKRTYKDYSPTEHQYLIGQIIPAIGTTYAELVQEIKEHEAVGDNAAKALVKLWIAEKYIFKRDERYKQNRKGL